MDETEKEASAGENEDRGEAVCDEAKEYLKGLTPDPAALRIVSPAYAGNEGELTAVLQYVYQRIVFERAGMTKCADALGRIAVEEMRHLQWLGEMIAALGAPPVYSYLPPYPINYYSARAVSYARTPQKMLLDDVAAEQYAVDGYMKILNRLKNDRAAAVIRLICAQEEEHLAVFKRLLAESREE